MSERDIRQTLQEAVGDLEPRLGLDEIQARTAPTRRRSWVWDAAGAVVATAATITAVAVVAGLPGHPGAPRPAPDPVDGQVSSVPVFFVGDTGAGPRLFEEHREFGGRSDVLRWSLRNVVEGNALDPDYTSHWPRTTTVDGVRRSRTEIAVDLSGVGVSRPSALSSTQAYFAVQQVVRTSQAVSGTLLPVRFLVDGRRVDSLLGVPTRFPVARGADDDTLAPVSISSPADQTAIDSPFRVTGQASAFEANVQWELKHGDQVVRHGFTTARRCCTLSPYSFRVRADPGTYTLVVHDEDASGGEGTPPSMDTKVIRVNAPE